MRFTGTGLQKFPIPPEKPLDLAVCLDHLAQEWQQHLPSQLAAHLPLSQAVLNAHKEKAATLLGSMIALQEELDWRCYGLYGLIDQDLCYQDTTGHQRKPPALTPGQRAFETVMARKMAAGELATTWFERHGSTPMTEIPAEWPDDYRRLVEQRIALIETNRNRNIALIEQPEYKRRWNTEPWEAQLERALRNWLLDRLESYFDFDGRMHDTHTPTVKVDMALISTARLADVARQDVDFMQVGELYRHDPAFNVDRLVTALVEAESVPLLPVLRYKPGGLRKRSAWEQTWALQRLEDMLMAGEVLDLSTWHLEEAQRAAIVQWQQATAEALSTKDQALSTKDQALSTKDQALSTKDQALRSPLTIPVPPRYTSSDFTSSTSWRLRGKLDVPKERWISFPHCAGADGTLVIAWAGYDHLQLARAISAYYVDIQEHRGGRNDPRLEPLLACLIALLPWLKQWHNDVDPEFGLQMGDYFEGFIQEEARQMGKTRDQITAWEPPKKTARRRQQAMT
jgi:hypothetical protein